MSSRQVLLNEYLTLKWDYHSNVYSSAILLNNIDNDPEGDFELAVGNSDGELVIFKPTIQLTPWKVCNNLGNIISVIFGDILNKGKESLCVVNTDGDCFIFDIDSNSDSIIQPIQIFPIPINITASFLADIDNDGKQELIVGTSEKIVYVLNFEKNQLNVKKDWQIPDEVVSLGLSFKASNLDPMIIVGLLRGSVVYISYVEGVMELDICQERYSSARHDDPIVVSGPVRTIKSRQSPLNVSASIDGNLILMENEKFVWEIQFDHQLFAVNTLDLTQDEIDEIIACSWDGMTYFVDIYRNVVRYRFPNKVKAFNCGKISLKKSEKVNCLVYLTFENDIQIYTGAMPTEIPNIAVIARLKDVFLKYPVLKEDQNSLDWTFNEQAALLHCCIHRDFITEKNLKYKKRLEQQLEELRKENEKLEAEIMKRIQISGDLS